MNDLHCTKLHKLVNKIWHFTCAYISYNNQQLPRRIYHTQSTANKYNVCSYIDPQAGADSQILYIFVCWKSAEKNWLVKELATEFFSAKNLPEKFKYPNHLPKLNIVIWLIQISISWHYCTAICNFYWFFRLMV